MANGTGVNGPVVEDRPRAMPHISDAHLEYIRLRCRRRAICLHQVPPGLAVGPVEVMVHRPGGRAHGRGHPPHRHRRQGAQRTELCHHKRSALLRQLDSARRVEVPPENNRHGATPTWHTRRPSPETAKQFTHSIELAIFSAIRQAADNEVFQMKSRLHLRPLISACCPRSQPQHSFFTDCLQHWYLNVLSAGASRSGR